MKKKIILISGDPNSINSEIIFKSYKKLKDSTKRKIFLLANYLMFQNQLKKNGYNLKLKKVKNIDDNEKSNDLKIIDINLRFKNSYYSSHRSVSRFVEKSFHLAHKLAQRKDVSGIINCALDKRLLNKKNTGVTEMLASLNKVKNNREVMLIYNKKLAVCPITTHLDLKQVSRKITKKLIFNKIITINEWFIKNINKRPRISILGLNPHNSELRNNSEEKKIIIPIIKKLKSKKINIKGPFSADTIFINDYKKFDVVVGMYHDQVLAPFKSIFKFDAINITLGLKYFRLSPDHGVAKDLIGKNKANPSSLIKCINFLEKFSK